ncbi:MAG: serine/threonine protein kinase, partial [Sandaracinaceae bacterium]|nr:serine/threonine protein kinase [Sandaracinaceae bacterium]
MLVCPLCRLALGPTETACPRDGQQGVQARQVDVPAGIRARFAIVEPLAQGQSGDLFIADDQQTGRRGVLKLLLLPESVTPAERNRLKRELVKQATLAHPVLCLPLATGDANGVAWIFRELRDGVSLRVRLARSGALPPSEALAVAAQLASALDELHRSGLLHRDIKPGHVLLEPQPSGLPRVSLIDAGIAARIDAGAVFDLQGTAEYVSPEQAQGKLVSFRSDLYALGCLLHEMLSGQPPFTGDVKSVLEAHVSSLPPASSATVPTGVTTLLAQLLAKEPRDRPFSAQQVRRALEPFLPEDAGTRREATQAFEKTAEKPADHTAAENTVEPSSPKAGTGTLR